MTLIQIVNTILVLILPALIALCYVFAQFFIQRFPVHQRGALEQFARLAVRYVHNEHTNLPEKKALSLAYATDLFRLSGLPEPHKDILEIAVGAAMHEIQQCKNG